MPLLKGLLSYVRFRVEGGVPQNFVESFERALDIRRFVPLHPEGQDYESYGFVPFTRPYADEMQLTNDQFLFGDLIVLGYREDVIALPKPLIKDQVEMRLEAESARLHRSPSRDMRKAIEDAVKSELRQRVLPKSKVVEVAWSLQDKQLRFFSRAKSTTDRFVKLFEQTFDARLKPMDFIEQAISASLPLSERATLESLTPQQIFVLPQRVEV